MVDSDIRVARRERPPLARNTPSPPKMATRSSPPPRPPRKPPILRPPPHALRLLSRSMPRNWSGRSGKRNRGSEVFKLRCAGFFVDTFHPDFVIRTGQNLLRYGSGKLRHGMPEVPSGSPSGARGPGGPRSAGSRPGIAPEQQDRVFDRFYRLHESRSRGSRGFGFGLSIARLAMERQGGRIEIVSQPGHGSTLRIVFTALDVSEDTASPDPET